MYAHIISLGHRCAIAWQVERYFNYPEHYFFDWLITPFDSLLRLFEQQFENFAALDQLEVWEVPNARLRPGILLDTVIETRYGIGMHHDFPREGLAVDRARIPVCVADVQSKYRHKAQKLLAVLRQAGPVLFVRTEGNFDVKREAQKSVLRAEQIEQFMAWVHTQNPQLDFDLLLVNMEEPIDRTWENVRTDIVRPAPAGYWPNANHAWKGFSEDWDAAFARTQAWRRQRSAHAKRMVHHGE